MNLVIWVQYDTIATQEKAKGQSLLKYAFAALDKPKGTVNIVGIKRFVENRLRFDFGNRARCRPCADFKRG